MAEGPIITLGTILQAKTNDLILAIRKNLEENNSIASRRLIQSIRTEVKVFGDVFSMSLWMEDYWKYVEHGRKAGKMPPIDEIIKWTSQKGIDIGKLSTKRSKLIKSLKNKRIRKGLKQRSKESLRRSAAFLIARKIGRKGTKATHFFSEVVNPTWAEGLKNDIAKALKRDYTVQIINAAA